jgi:chromosome segregation ATPase
VNARALADDGLSPALNSPPAILPIDTHTGNNSDNFNASTSSLQAPSSPNRRISLTPGGTTKVLADLQAGVSNARNALENTKSQLRLSQRTVAQLTRQTEDLKEGRERLRLENEGLNNVVARKERLLQEVLERARKAEAEAATLKSQLKTETATSKKSLREMESALAESTALSQKAEREYITLRDSIKSMTESWKHDTDKLREEMRKREDKLKKEAESVGKKYKLLADEMKEAQRQQASVKDLKNEDQKIRKEVEEEFREEIIKLKARVELQSHQSDEAVETAKTLASELARLRRLMQSGTKSPPPDNENPPP